MLRYIYHPFNAIEVLTGRQRSELSPFARFAIAVGEGKYKDNKVFLGLVETMQLATERKLKGVGMQNFKYPLEFREWGSLLRMTSPRAYRNMAQHFRMETPRSIKYVVHSLT